MSPQPVQAQASLLAYRLLIFDRQVTPGLFNAQKTRSIRSDNYDFEMLVSHGSHLVQFGSRGHWLGESITPAEYPTTPVGCIESLPCLGERDHDGYFPGDVRYIVTIQTENISENLYRSMLAEMIEFARSNNALCHRWTQSGSRMESGSFMDVQRLHNEVHFQAWHMDATTGLIVRSQTIFELMPGNSGEDDPRREGG